MIKDFTKCAICGIEILQTSRVHKYCSVSCRMRAYRARLQESRYAGIIVPDVVITFKCTNPNCRATNTIDLKTAKLDVAPRCRGCGKVAKI